MIPLPVIWSIISAMVLQMPSNESDILAFWWALKLTVEIILNSDNISRQHSQEINSLSADRW